LYIVYIIQLVCTSVENFALQRRPHAVVGQTRAQAVLLLEGGVPVNAASLPHGRRNTSLCSAPLMIAPLEPSLAGHSMRGLAFCKREVLG